MKQAIWALTLLVLAATMPACTQATFRTPLGRITDAASDLNKMGYTIRWKAPTPPIRTTTHISSSAILGDLLVTVEHPDNILTAISMNNGGVVWRQELITRSEQLYKPFRRKNYIAVNTASDIYRFGVSNGGFEEITKLPGVVTGAPAITDGVGIFTSIDHHVYGIGIDTGTSEWDYVMDSGILVPPLIIGDTVFITDAAGSYALLYTANGRVLWRENQVFERISVEPVASPENSLVYVACEDQNLYGINLVTGVVHWTFPTPEPLTVAPVLIGNIIYLTLPHAGDLIAIDAAGGGEIWRLHERVTPVAIVGSTLVGFSQSSLVVLDLASGRKLRQAPIGDEIISVTPGPKGSLIIITVSGQVIRLDPRS